MISAPSKAPTISRRLEKIEQQIEILTIERTRIQPELEEFEELGAIRAKANREAKKKVEKKKKKSSDDPFGF